MESRDATRQGDASIYKLGSWAGARPVQWIRVAAAAELIGYGIVLGFHLLTGVALGREATEILCIVGGATALAVAGRWPAAAGWLALGSAALDLFVSTVVIAECQYVSAVVLPLYVLCSGLFFGARGAVFATVGSAALYPISLAISGRYGVLLDRLPAMEVTRLAVTETVVVASGALTALVVRTFLKVHAEAEELRRLEIRLQHTQRLHVVGQLAGVAAHDFRNVLAIFQNAAGLLSMSEDPTARTLGADLLQTARSGQAITRRLLSLARHEEPKRSPIDVARTVEALRPLVTRLLGPRCTLALEVQGPATALADPAEIEQVVLNLAANARDSMAWGGRVRLAVRSLSRPEAERLGSRLAAGQQIVVEVQDHGTGIAPELHERIFEPFVTTKARGEGTGLGLATVRSIAVASGGEVALESTPGAGATFRVFLPRAEGVAFAPTPTPHEVTQPIGVRSLSVVTAATVPPRT